MAENDIQNSKSEELDTIDTQVTTSNEQNESADTPEPSKSHGHSKDCQGHYSGCSKRC